MAIEIRELVIRAEVSEMNQAQENARDTQAMGPTERSYLIQECVERVFEMIKRQNQR